ncbi:Gfo/Idh/MocA family oxidoreductase [Phycisphaeraceae bacterium D3-23]
MDETQSKQRVAVVGVGRMGRHHARTLKNNVESAELVGVVDGDASRARTVAEEYGTTPYTSVEALLKAEPELQAAVIAVPTVYHTAAAQPLLECGIACLIEKPIAGSSDEAGALVAFAKQHGALLQIGHTERFNPAVRALAKLKLTPRLIQVTRVSPMTFRSMDVGVVMDMMIHDLDIVLSLVGRPLATVEAVGERLLGEHEDLCDARLTFEGGCVATVRGSRLAMGTERTLRLYSDDGFVSLDYGNRTGIIVRQTANAEALASVRERLRQGEDLSGQNYLEMLRYEPLAVDLPPGQDDPLTAQATAFLESASNGTAPVVSADDGVAAVDAAERIVAAIGTVA